jgi:hypothetical protein
MLIVNNPSTVQNNSVTSTAIANFAVTTEKIANQAITSDKLGQSAIDALNITSLVFSIVLG